MRRTSMIASAAGSVLAALLLLPGAAFAGSKDRNRDGIPDSWERSHHLSVSVKQTNRDQDHDGLTNLGEYRSRTDPRDADTDNDGVDDANEDRDRDGVDNGNETLEDTNPADRDSDDDGVSDGREDADRDKLNNHVEDVTGNDPTDSDTDNDGVKDGSERAGVVVRFEDGVLTITVGGREISGKVTDATDIGCDEEGDLEDSYDGDRGAGHRGASSSEQADEAAGDGQADDSDADPSAEAEHGGGDASKESDDSETPTGEDVGHAKERCSVDDLKPGTAVHEAELKITADGPIFSEIELIKPLAAPSAR